MPANPEIVIQLPKDRYSGLYKQWVKIVDGLPTDALVRLRLLLLLRAGIVARENLGLPIDDNKAAGEPSEKKSRRKRKKAKSFHTIRCRVDTRMYPDVLDEWRALPRGVRSEVFAEYLRIGMKMTPDELRTTTQTVARNIAWKPAAKLHDLPGAAMPLRGETVIMSDTSDTKAAAATTAKLAENFLTLDD